MDFSFHVNVFIDIAIVLILFMQPLLGETTSQPTIWHSHNAMFPEAQMQGLWYRCIYWS